MKKRSTCPCGNAGKHRGDFIPNVRGHCETADCIPGCNLFTTQPCGSHLSMAQRANLNLGLAETVLGGRRFYPTQSIWICLGHRENKSNLPSRFTLRSSPIVSNQRRARVEIPPIPCSPWHPEGLWGRSHSSPRAQRWVYLTEF